MRVLTALAVMVGPVCASDWRALDQAGAVEVLTDRVLVYEGGETQDFRASGRTLYDAGSAELGVLEDP